MPRRSLATSAVAFSALAASGGQWVRLVDLGLSPAAILGVTTELCSSVRPVQVLFTTPMELVFNGDPYFISSRSGCGGRQLAGNSRHHQEDA